MKDTSRSVFLRSFLGRFVPLAAVGVLGGLYTYQVTGWQVESVLFGAGILGALAVGAWSWTRSESAHRLAERQLMERLALSDEVLNSVRDVVLVADETGAVRYASPSVKSSLGYDPEEVLGDGWWRVSRGSPTEGEEEKAASVRRAKGEVEEGWGEPYDRMMLHRDGTPRWVRWRESPGPGRTIVGIGSDVTDRKAGEEAGKRLAALVENTSGFIGYAWPDGEVEFINPGGRKLVGLGDAFDPSTTTMMDFVAPVDRDRFREHILPQVFSGRGWKGELRLTDFAGGDPIPVHGNIFPVMDEEGERPLTVCGSFMDLREQKLLELNLVEALHKAEEAGKAKQQFLANMSHEIRTPMNAIIGMADLLWETPLAPEQEEYVRVFRSSGETLLALINDLLDLAKVEEGRLDLEEVGFCLTDLLEEAVEVFSVQAREKGLTMEAQVGPGVPSWVAGDPVRLRQILANLLGNAVKFTDAGGVLASVSVASGQACGDAHSVGERLGLCFSVADTGMGIPRDRLDTVFERFMQVDSSTTRRAGGSGLGLAICRKLVELMGGRIWVESEEGRGSTFHFALTLPVAAPSEEHEVEASALVGLRMLVADGNTASRLVLREILMRWSVRVTETEDGSSALEALRAATEEERPFHLLIVDDHLPGMDGYALAARVRDESTLGRPRVVVLTDRGSAPGMEKLRECGISAPVMKPVRRASLHHAISGAIGGRRLPVSGEASAADPVAGESSRPLQILVVDDSYDNRALIAAYLRMTPHRTEFATNGQEAVDILRLNRAFDLVLMDIQMPVMDGHTATRAIRAWEREEGLEAMRIFALSAHALEEEIRESLTSGCDDHLTKPIRKQVLLDTLAAVARATQASDAHGAVPDGPRVDRIEVAGAGGILGKSTDRAGVPETSGLLREPPAGLESEPMLEGPITVVVDEGLIDLIPQYLDNRRNDVQALAAAVLKGDFDTIRRLGHGMKGSGGGYGLDAVTEVGWGLEESAKARNSDDARRWLEKLEDFLERVRVLSGREMASDTDGAN